MTIRPLCPWEEEDMLPIAEQFYNEARELTKNEVGTFDPVACLYSWRSIPIRCAMGLFKGGNLVGVLAGFIAPQFMTGQPIAQEVFWYVSPEHRGGTAGVKLFLEFEKWATDNKAYGIVMASLSENPQVGDLYRRKGYTHLESHHLKTF